jgi:hypothetical protein
MSNKYPSNDRNESGQQERDARKERVHHKGYSPVLCQTYLKDQLRDFRHNAGLGYDTHIERCLVTAAIKGFLDNSDLHDLWLTVLAEVVKQDILLTASPQVRGSGSAVNRHAAPGPEPLARGANTPRQ